MIKNHELASLGHEKEAEGSVIYDSTLPVMVHIKKVQWLDLQKKRSHLIKDWRRPSLNPLRSNLESYWGWLYALCWICWCSVWGIIRFLYSLLFSFQFDALCMLPVHMSTPFCYVLFVTNLHLYLVMKRKKEWCKLQLQLLVLNLLLRLISRNN